MILKYKDELNKLPNCPLVNDENTIKVYRWSANDPIQESDFLPLALEEPKRNFPEDKICLSWGVSTHNTITATKNAIRIFSKKKRDRMKTIYSIEIDKTLALKHQSGCDKNHYTVYQYENIDIIGKFSQEII